MNGAFNGQILAEKLKKLNNSQQSIETLSHWCIFHRKKAQLVVETWDKHLRELSKDKRVPFLYLANDILQNSRRRGAEFVTEFWKILPGALKDVIETGDSQAQTVVYRLVDIWDERKVFGSRSRTLREELLGNDPPADLSEHRIKPNQTIKIKVPAGGILEKLTQAYRSVQDVASDEDATLGRCNAAVIRIEGLEKEANVLQSSGESQDITTLADELQEQENILSLCSEQLEISELARAALVSHLKEALREQESKLELIRNQLQTARNRAEHSSALRDRLLASNTASAREIIQYTSKDTKSNGGSNVGSISSIAVTNAYQWQPTEAMATVIEEPKKVVNVTTSAAAEVAAKLAASSSSVQMLTSVLSSIVAEEKSNKRTASAPLETSANLFFADKRHRVDGQVDQSRGLEDSPVYVQPQPPLGLQGNGLQQFPTSLQPLVTSTQQVYPPLPPLPPQPQYVGNSGNGNIQTAGYAGVLQHPHQPIPMLGQLMMGTQMTTSAQSGTYPLIQPSGALFYGHNTLPGNR